MSAFADVSVAMVMLLLTVIMPIPSLLSGLLILENIVFVCLPVLCEENGGILCL